MPSRAGNERREERGDPAVPPRLENAGGHDGRHRAAVTEDQGEHRFAVQADAVHEVVEDVRDAGQVSRVLEHGEADQEWEEVRKNDRDAARKARKRAGCDGTEQCLLRQGRR